MKLSHRGNPEGGTMGNVWGTIENSSKKSRGPWLFLCGKYLLSGDPGCSADRENRRGL